MKTENLVSNKSWATDLLHTHIGLLDYVESLPEADLLWSEEGRWNALQQVRHVYLCLAALSQALTSKEYIEQKFGRIDRPTWSYNEVIDRYKSGLVAGGKSPERFIPGTFESTQKSEVNTELVEMLQTMLKQLNAYSDEECDSLVLPHPFVGKLTIKEMIFLMTEHANIHRASIENGLKKRISTDSL